MFSIYACARLEFLVKAKKKIKKNGNPNSSQLEIYM